MRIFRRSRAEPGLSSAAKGRARRAHWSYAAAVALPALIVVVFGLLRPPLLDDLGNLLFDSYQRLAPRPWESEAPVRIVDIDDESLARIGQWPWPRSTIAALIERLTELGAAALAFDVLFAEPDAKSPESLVRLLPATPGRAVVEADFVEAKTNDAKLAEALAGIPSVLAAVLNNDAVSADLPTKFGIATAGDDPRPFLPAFNTCAGSSMKSDAINSASRDVLAITKWRIRRLPLAPIGRLRQAWLDAFACGST